MAELRPRARARKLSEPCLFPDGDPSLGPVGTFTVDRLRHGRSYVPKNSCYVAGGLRKYAIYPHTFDVLGISSKQISGPGLATATWTTSYGPANASWDADCPSTSCPSTRTVTTSGPSGTWSRQTYGNRYRENEGKLLIVETGSSASAILRTDTTSYLLDPTGQAYPSRVGASANYRSERASEKFAPAWKQTTVQQGATFTWQVPSATGVYSFDAYANPTQVTRSSAGLIGTATGYSRSEATTYAHNTTRWVLGQVATVTDVATGLILGKTDYDATSALPVRSYSVGLLQQTIGYNADGTLATVMDGRNNSTTFSNWYRGIPRLISYPNSASESAVVNAIGTVASVTDELGSKTSYSYDALGRLAGITYPTGDSVVWNATTRSFVSVAAVEYGLPAGHWKQTVTTGNGRATTYYDAQWHPVLTLTEDTTNARARVRSPALRCVRPGDLQSYPVDAWPASTTR